MAHDGGDRVGVRDRNMVERPVRRLRDRLLAQRAVALVLVDEALHEHWWWSPGSLLLPSARLPPVGALLQMFWIALVYPLHAPHHRPDAAPRQGTLSARVPLREQE